MKKLILIVLLLASSNSSWALKCFKGVNDSTIGAIAIIPDGGSEPYTNDYRCRQAGHARSAEDQDIVTSNLKPKYNQTTKNDVTQWLSSLEHDFQNDCDPALPPTQMDFYKSLKIITGKMNCDNSNTKNSKEKKLSSDNIFFQEDTLSKVQACTCMVQEGPAPKMNKEFKETQLQKISNYITEEYIGNLAPSRIYQYSLESNILPNGSVEACNQLVMDIEVQEFVKNNLEKTAPEAKLIFGKMTAEDTLSIYKKTQSNGEKIGAIPVVTREGFEKFGTYWAETLTKAQSTNSYKKLKDNLCSLATAKVTDYFEFDLNDKTKFTEVISEDKATAPITQEDREERAFLDKMLCSRIGSGETLLIDEISKELFNLTNSPKKVQTAFMDNFTEIVSKDINNRCKKSEEHLGQLSKGSMAAILNDNGLLKTLFGINQKDKGLIQHYYCQMMKKQLKSSPEYFLEQFCDYKLGEPLPPNRCVSIGDFINTTFVYEDEGTDNNTENPNSQQSVVSTIVEGIKKDEKITDSIKRKISDVQVSHIASLSDVTQRAASFVGPNKSGKVRINLESYQAPEHREVSVTKKTEPVANNLKTGRNTNSMMTQGNNILPSKAFAPLKRVSELGQTTTPQAAAAQPVITYEKRSVTVNNATDAPPPISSQVISPPPVIKKKAPRLFKEEKEISSFEEDEDEVIVEPKKNTSYLKNADKKESAKSTSIAFSNSKNNSNSSGVNITTRTSGFQEATNNPSSIPEEAVRSYTEARRFDQSFSQNRINERTHYDEYKDPVSPETGIMLSAFRTGKIGNKNLTKVIIGEEIKDLKSFERTNTYHGPVVIVEDKTKKERYICRAIVNDLTDGSEKFIGLEAAAPKENELAGYKCTNEVIAQENAKASKMMLTEKQEAIKTLSTNERMYKAFVLDKIIKNKSK